MRVAKSALGQAFSFNLVAQNRMLSCRVGCAHCCTWPMDVTILEGIDICSYLMAKNRWTTRLREKVQLAADTLTGLTFQIWVHSQTTCIFLDDTNHCTIYERRPFVCQCTVSTGLPSECQNYQAAQGVNVVPRVLHTMAFRNVEETILSAHRVKMHTMPLATALLAAEPICLGNMELWQANASVFAEHLGRV